MGISIDDWHKRISSRTDLTGRITHLTKPSEAVTPGMSFEDINIKAVDNLINILKNQKINGSTTKSGYIVGNKKAVCFQDAPLYALIQNVEHEKYRRDNNPQEKLRYCGVGLSFIKSDVYWHYGGRPVIYEKTDIAKQFLPQEEWWRIVNYEFKHDEKQKNWDVIDWTHEREWRVPGDMEFQFDKGYVHVVLYNPACFKYFLKECPPEIVNKLWGITTLTSVLM
ncbi:DUF2971 domain-containing protein [Ectobacillus funiculus]|uniref:DUF2971 domain-containing protein n=1 Tax=Ectobacillus funiculus TaxID=137993 RepID=UPI00101CA21B|nr:DUF2971 domain-containing protein [Ectobacillus funiculus]